MYLLHPKFATDPRHYIRAFLLLQNDISDLFSYVEPSDVNLRTYSHRIQQLLVRACIEIEANFTAILVDNHFPRADQSLTIRDYKLIDLSHKLSLFQVRIPGWKGEHGLRSPFAGWANDQPLSWYQAYNKSKHNRHKNFHLATFDALMDAYTGLNILLSAQFLSEEYGPSKGYRVSANYTYEGRDGMDSSIGNLLRIRFPNNLQAEERYDFSWGQLEELEDPFVDFPYEEHV